MSELFIKRVYLYDSEESRKNTIAILSLRKEKVIDSDTLVAEYCEGINILDDISYKEVVNIIKESVNRWLDNEDNRILLLNKNLYTHVITIFRESSTIVGIYILSKDISGDINKDKLSF